MSRLHLHAHTDRHGARADGDLVMPDLDGHGAMVFCRALSSFAAADEPWDAICMVRVRDEPAQPPRPTVGGGCPASVAAMMGYLARAKRYARSRAGCGQSSPTGDSAEPISSVAPAIIAFASDRDHEGPSEDFAALNTEIYTMTADGDEIVRITHDPGIDLYPRWSGTGSEIAFMSNRDSGTESMDLYVIDLDTRVVRRISTTGGVFGFEWSADDSHLVYAHETSTGTTIRTISADGTHDRFVVEGSWPSFSPDGSQILFTQGEFFEEPQSLATFDIASGSVTPVRLPLDNASESMWSPEGDRMAFMSNPNGYDGEVGDWDEEIYVAALDGTGVVRVSNRAGNDHWPPSRVLKFS